MNREIGIAQEYQQASDKGKVFSGILRSRQVIKRNNIPNA